MEPSLISEGNRLWDHYDVSPEHPASMEPSLISEGNMAAVAGASSGNPASMEPSLISEGNAIPYRRPCAPPLLQWSPR